MNREQREREFVTPGELEKLLEAAKYTGRHGLRDVLLISMAWIHGMRAGELVKLKWSDIDLEERKIHIKRLKGNLDTSHVLTRVEVKQLKELNEGSSSAYVFPSERKNSALSVRTVHAIVARAGENAGLEFSIHPQMLATGRGFQLVSEGWEANKIQEYLGHKTSRMVDSLFLNIKSYLEHVKKHPFLLEKGIPVLTISSAEEAMKNSGDTENSITVEVPASTCNLGPGLDTIGLALSLYTRLTFTLTDNRTSTAPMINISGAMTKLGKASEHSDLIYTVLSKIWQYEPDILNRIKIDVDSDVPLGCGLGSVSTVVLGAIWASHIFQGKLPSCKTLMNECRAMESHSETTAASLLGGMVIYGYDPKGEDLVHHVEWPESWRVIIANPGYSMKTADSRKVLPVNYQRADVIQNIQRASLLVASVYDRDEELMKKAMVDHLHEKYREDLIPEFSKIKELLAAENIIGCVLSGGGSSTSIVVNENEVENILDILTDWKEREKNNVTFYNLKVPNYGMREVVYS